MSRLEKCRWLTAVVRLCGKAEIAVMNKPQRCPSISFRDFSHEGHH